MQMTQLKGKKEISNIFGWLEEITFHKSPINSFSEKSWEIWNSYMIHRFVSMTMNYIELANYTQKFHPQDKKQIYTVYRDLLPKKKIFSKYIKPNKKFPNKDLVQFIANYFECSKKEAEEVINMLDKKEINNILSNMGVDSKEAKKLTK